MGCKQLLSAFTGLFLLFSGCKKLDPKIDTPSYITINNYAVNYTGSYSNGGPGTTNHNFTDVQLYVNGKSLGTYPVPGNIPVIAEGQANILVNPVIKTNGVSALRAEYPFMKLYESTINLVKGQQTNVTPVFDYFPGINFRWTEDFESSGYSIIGYTTADTCFRRVSTEKFEGNNSLEIKLYNGYNECRVTSSTGYYLPGNSSDVYLEFNYKATQGFEVGIIGGGSDIRPAGGVNATSTWKKMYVYLTPAVSQPPSYSTYKVYFYLLNNGGTPQVNIDNIKLISK